MRASRFARVALAAALVAVAPACSPGCNGDSGGSASSQAGSATSGGPRKLNAQQLRDFAKSFDGGAPTVQEGSGAATK